MNMNKEIRDSLSELIEVAGFEPRSYSGRGMYGRQCVGVTVPHSGVLSLGAELAYAVADKYDDDTMRDALDSFREVMADARQDSMGLDAIVYWPSAAWVGEEGR